MVNKLTLITCVWLQREFTEFRSLIYSRNLAPAKNTKTSADFSKYSTFADSSNSGSSVLERDEIATYLLLPPPPSTKSVPEVWKDYKPALPKLHTLAMKIFSTQAASSLSERLFSDTGNIFTDKRSLLISNKLDDLLFLKWNV